jgi:sec-independent protein translocase protein TatA
MDFGPAQIAIVLIIGLLVFGPKRLPELGKSLGSGMREFKDSITGEAKRAQPSAKPELEAGSPAASTSAVDHREAVETEAELSPGVRGIERLHS